MIAGVFSVHAASPRILPGMICSHSCLSAWDVPVEAQAGILVSSDTSMQALERVYSPP